MERKTDLHQAKGNSASRQPLGLNQNTSSSLGGQPYGFFLEKSPATSHDIFMMAPVARPSDHSQQFSWPLVSPYALAKPSCSSQVLHFYLEMFDLTTWQRFQVELITFPSSYSSSLFRILMNSLPTLPTHLPKPDHPWVYHPCLFFHLQFQQPSSYAFDKC